MPDTVGGERPLALSGLRSPVLRAHGRAAAAYCVRRCYETWPEQADAGTPVAVACCVPRERHSLGLMMVADALRAGVVEVHLLGEGLPTDAVIEFIARVDDDLMGLSCAMDVHLPEVADLSGGPHRCDACSGVRQPCSPAMETPGNPPGRDRCWSHCAPFMPAPSVSRASRHVYHQESDLMGALPEDREADPHPGLRRSET